MKRLLEHFIIAINYSELLETDVEELIRLTRGYFVDKGFMINQGVHKNINIELNDPEYVEKSLIPNTDITKKYVYTFNNIEISITRLSVEMLVNAGSDYLGFGVYKDYIVYIINTMLEHFGSFVSISRIGIRKINSLFIKDITRIESYFAKQLFNCCEVNELLGDAGGSIHLSGNHLTTVCGRNKTNILTEVQIGNAPECIAGIENIINVYRLILDIDVYWDKELEDYSCIEQKLIDLNECTTNIYKNCLNTEFMDQLESDDDVIDSNIYGGIK